MRGAFRCACLLALLSGACSQLLAGQWFGRLYLSPGLGHWMTYRPENLLGDGPMWGARGGLYLNRLIGLEGGLARSGSMVLPDRLGRLGQHEGRYRQYSGGVRLGLPLGSLAPFVSAAAGRAELELDRDLVLPDGAGEVAARQRRRLLVLGAGVEYFFTGHLALRAAVHDHYLERPFASPTGKPTHNLEFGAGVTLVLGRGMGGADRTASLPDADLDGIPDGRDLCPGTLPGLAVGPEGCPVDQDGDGVPDERDDCPGTPPGALVDSSGCPTPPPPPELPDSAVEGMDSDSDGIIDQLDLEPFTPRGALVDRTGRALDGDRDGVPDGLDQCPGTEAGIRVDREGCPEPDEDRFYLVLDFPFNSGAVRPEHYEQLKRVARRLQATRGVGLELVAHLSHRGRLSANRRAAETRARAIRDFLAGEGVPPERMRLLISEELIAEPGSSGEAARSERFVVVRLAR